MAVWPHNNGKEQPERSLAVQEPQFEVMAFEDTHQKQVEDLVLPIQQNEFGVPITLEEQPDLMGIREYFQRGNGNFWVAHIGSRVIGTIGVVDIGDSRVALKKMFVHRDFRGRAKGVSAALMNIAKQWCRSRGVEEIFLGTTAQMVGAHKFYEQHGFSRVEPDQLPESFPRVTVDTVFYRRQVSSPCAATAAQ